MTKVLSSNWMRAGLALMLVAALTFGVATPALAGEFVDGTDVVIGEDEVYEDDLFLSGESVEMNGTVQGDLFAFGQVVVINGVVEGNVIAGGQSVRVNGEVHGSVIASGAEVLVGAQIGNSFYGAGFEGALLEGATVGGSSYFGGYSFDTEVETTIERSLYVGGYQLLVAGAVGKDLNAGLGAFELTGTVGEDVHIEYDASGEAPPSSAFYGVPITRPIPNVAPGADASEGEIGGEYVAEAVIVETPEIEPEVTLTPQQARQAAMAGFVSGVLNRIRARVGEFIGLLAAAVLLLWLAREPFMAATNQLREKALPSFGWGLGALIVFPFALLLFIFLAVAVVLIVSFMTLGEFTGLMMGLTGTTFGGFILVVTVLAYIVGKLVVGYVAGQWIFKQVAPSVLDSRFGAFWAIALGIFLFELLRAVPFFGWLLGLVVVSFGFGAVVSLLYERYRARRLPAEAAAA